MSQAVIKEEHDTPRRSWPIFLAIVALIIIGLGLWAYFASRPTQAAVVRKDIVGYVTLNGQVVAPPEAAASVTAPYQTTVESVHASVGERVHRGDVLVRLNLPAQQTALQQADQTLRQAQSAYSNAQRTYNAPVFAAQQRLAAARAAAQSTAVTPGPNGTVLTPPAPTPSTDVAAAQQELANAQAARDSALSTYAQQLSTAKAYYDEAKSGAKLSLVRAPITGTVLTLDAQPGAEVGTDQRKPVAYIVNLDKLIVQADVPKDEVGYIKPDQPVRLTFTDLPNQVFEGKVLRLTTQTETKAAGLINQQHYIVLVSFENTKEQVKPGMKPSVAIEVGSAKDAVAVPADAVDNHNGQPIVKVYRNRMWQEVAVVPGVSDGRYTQIKQGVKPGETVQVTPNILNAATKIK